MSTRRLASVAALVVTLSPGPARSDPQEPLVSDDATLNEAMLQYRSPSLAGFAWVNPYLPGATGDSPTVADATESADRRMARIVAEYDRRMLDRGGWENPYLPSGSAGNPLLAVAVGAGVTQEGASEEEEGAASGEPDEDDDLTK